MMALLILTCPVGVLAQKGTDRGGEQMPAEYLNVEQILDVVVRNIAARYNLNEEQTSRTDDLMKREVYRFLQEHHDAVWPVVRELLKGQVIGQLPLDDPDEIKRLGRAAKPLAKLAQKAITDANMEWREWLSPEQKRLHDFDLDQMDRQFKGIHQNLDSWERGEPIRRNIFPPPEEYVKEPIHPARPDPGIPKGKPDLPDQVGRVTTDADMFATYVEEFIKDYKLDPSQINSARSILKEFQNRATSYLETNKDALSRANAAQEAAVKKRDHKAIQEAEAARRELLEPVNGLFVKMDERLQALLTSAQKEESAEKKKSTPKEKTEPAKKTMAPKKQKAEASKGG